MLFLVPFEVAKNLPKDQHIVINVSGRGDKDVQSVAEVLPKLGDKIGWDLRFEDASFQIVYIALQCIYNDIIYINYNNIMSDNFVIYFCTSEIKY